MRRAHDLASFSALHGLQMLNQRIDGLRACVRLHYSLLLYSVIKESLGIAVPAQRLGNGSCA
jgi:hypothetical protein